MESPQPKRCRGRKIELASENAEMGVAAG